MPRVQHAHTPHHSRPTSHLLLPTLPKKITSTAHKETNHGATAISKRIRKPLQYGSSCGRPAARAKLAATLPLWSVRRTVVRHGLHLAPARKSPQLALPHQAFGG